MARRMAMIKVLVSISDLRKWSSRSMKMEKQTIEQPMMIKRMIFTVLPQFFFRLYSPFATLLCRRFPLLAGQIVASLQGINFTAQKHRFDAQAGDGVVINRFG